MKFSMPTSDNEMLKSIKLKTKDNFRKVTILLLDILQKHFRYKN